MRIITLMILLLAITLLPACKGTPGENGLDGDSLLGTVFEIEGDFTPANGWMLNFEFPNTIEVFESDAVLVYILWEQANNLDVWRLLPRLSFCQLVFSNIITTTPLLMFRFSWMVPLT